MNLKQGVAVLPSQSISVSSSYRDLAQTKFGVDFQSVTYQDPSEAAGTINRWVQAQTGDKVQQLVTNLDFKTQLLLATVAYYQSMYRQSEGGVKSQRVCHQSGGGVSGQRCGYLSTPSNFKCLCSSLSLFSPVQSVLQRVLHPGRAFLRGQVSRRHGSHDVPG